MSEHVETLLQKCESFERCGPLSASVFRVSGSAVTVLQECIKWPEEIERKITKDSRTSQLGDLLSLKRDQFGMALDSVIDRLGRVEGAERKPKGPGMG